MPETGRPGLHHRGGGGPEAAQRREPRRSAAAPGLAPPAYPGGRIPGHQRQPERTPVPPALGLERRGRPHPHGGGGPQAVHLRLAPGPPASFPGVPGGTDLRGQAGVAPDAFESHHEFPGHPHPHYLGEPGGGRHGHGRPQAERRAGLCACPSCPGPGRGRGPVPGAVLP